VGFGILRDGRRTSEMKAQWQDLLQRPHVREALGPEARIDGTPKAWPIPARVDRAVLASGRALFVGDAAAATDPMTGEGIAQALDSGIAAGEAIAAAGALAPDRARQEYEAAMARSLVPDHRMSVALQHALRTALGARAAVRIAGVSPWTRRNFGRWLFEDEPRAVLLTPPRWHRRFLDRDGAYR
jgi:flavin-dependent dehydrogenase